MDEKNFLNYLDSFTDNGKFVTIKLKEISKNSMNEIGIVKEIYKYLFSYEITDTDLEKISESTYKIKRYYKKKK